jgi:hypothetical protein
LKTLNVSDSLKIIESNPTMGAVIPKLNIRRTDNNLRKLLLIIVKNAKDNNIQLKMPKIVWKRTIAEKLARNVNKYAIKGMRVG